MATDKTVQALKTILELQSTKCSAKEGMTIAELRTETGWGEDRTRAALREAQKTGRLTVGRRACISLDGLTRMVPVYKVTT